MLVSNVHAVYFSPTGATEKVAATIAQVVSQLLKAKKYEYNFTLAKDRTKQLSFNENDLVILGTPVYAGRIPNLLIKFLNTITGNGALAVPVSLFGNRSFDDALIEGRDLLMRRGFKVVAAGAFVGEHSFSYTLSAGRPDEKDMALVRNFAQQVATKIETLESASPLLALPGAPFPHSGYYKPRDAKGQAVDLRKVKPKTAMEICVCCGICANACPMGAIDSHNPAVYVEKAVCILCGACIKKCPMQARYYDDPAYLYHKKELEDELGRRAEPSLFL